MVGALPSRQLPPVSVVTKLGKTTAGFSETLNPKS